MKFKPPYLVAEISANHCGNFNLAKKLIKCAKINGADAVKLQTYTADTMTLKSNKKNFIVKKGLWKNYSLWELYKKAHTPWKWHRKLFEYAKKLNIAIFSTPFDESAVDLLEKLKCPIYKIASFEMKDIPLIKKVSSTKKPIIISTGMASMKDIEFTYKSAKKYGAKDITLLYCVSNYPSKISDFHMNNIKIMKKKFNCRIGFSDHSKNSLVACSAVAAGAEIVEKHIALDNQKKGLDIEFSLKGKEIYQFKSDLINTYRMFEKKEFFRKKEENKSKFFQRSIYVCKDIKKYEVFTKYNLRRIRPGNGLDPKYYEKIIGRKSPSKLKKEEPLNKSILKKLNISTK